MNIARKKYIFGKGVNFSLEKKQLIFTDLLSLFAFCSWIICPWIVWVMIDDEEVDFRKVFDDLSSVETLSSFIHLLQLYKVFFSFLYAEKN